MSEWLVQCSVCGKAVDAQSRYTYHRVEGWERPGRNGGSDIVDRRSHAEFAHPQCVDDVKHGRLGQVSLVPDPGPEWDDGS